MDKEKIIQIVTKYISQVLNGQEAENPKLDFKREWYNMKSKSGINEFLKDSSAIANTFGPDGYLIIGIDEQNLTQVDVNFKDSQLNDSNELLGIISKRMDRIYDVNYFEEVINSKLVGILHIPQSLDKPHVIKNYQTFFKDGNLKNEEQHRIFVRSGTSTRIATKYDIELMFYDRKNIHPDYMLDIFINEVFFTETELKKLTVICVMNIENIGKRPASIKDIALNFSFTSNEFRFLNPDVETEVNGYARFVKVNSRNIIVKSNDITQKRMRLFYSGEGYSKQADDLTNAIFGIISVEAELFLNNGKKITKNCKLLFK